MNGWPVPRRISKTPVYSYYPHYINYELADAHNKLGDHDESSAYCATALELNPEFEPATRLCGELKSN